ncbi:hypothetical protein [Paenibacillus sp. NRS-1760]|uniref:hypothetical protein n=1 Tax=Paenibacillus sp. NRS-1760 TaxID=3233902 RepID=UPI003D281030
MKVKMLISYKGENYPVIPKDEILKIRVLDNIFTRHQVVEGRFSGLFVPFECFIEVVPTEPTYSAADVEQLQHNAVRLQRENKELQNRVKHKKVVLPKEVAEAIVCCEAEGLDRAAIPFLLSVIEKLFRDYSRQVLNALDVIKEYATSSDDKLNLLTALVDDFTFEEQINREQRLRSDLQKLFTGWEGSGRLSELAKDADRLLENHFSEIKN